MIYQLDQLLSGVPVKFYMYCNIAIFSASKSQKLAY